MDFVKYVILGKQHPLELKLEETAKRVRELKEDVHDIRLATERMVVKAKILEELARNYQSEQ